MVTSKCIVFPHDDISIIAILIHSLLTCDAWTGKLFANNTNIGTCMWLLRYIEMVANNLSIDISICWLEHTASS